MLAQVVFRSLEARQQFLATHLSFDVVVYSDGDWAQGLTHAKQFLSLRFIPVLQLYFKGNILFLTAPCVLKKYPLSYFFFSRPLICLWSAYFDHLLDRMSYSPIIRLCVIEPVCQCLELLYRTELGILRIFTTTWNNFGSFGKMNKGTVPKHHGRQVGWSSGNKFNTLKYTPFFLSSWAH